MRCPASAVRGRSGFACRFAFLFPQHAQRRALHDAGRQVCLLRWLPQDRRADRLRLMDFWLTSRRYPSLPCPCPPEPGRVQDSRRNPDCRGRLARASCKLRRLSATDAPTSDTAPRPRADLLGKDSLKAPSLSRLLPGLLRLSPATTSTLTVPHAKARALGQQSRLAETSRALPGRQSCEALPILRHRAALLPDFRGELRESVGHHPAGHRRFGESREPFHRYVKSARANCSQSRLRKRPRSFPQFERFAVAD